MHTVRPEPEGRGETGWVVVILRQRQEIPRWANDFVWQSKILGQRQGTPRWEDEPVWFLYGDP